MGLHCFSDLFDPVLRIIIFLFMNRDMSNSVISVCFCHIRCFCFTYSFLQICMLIELKTTNLVLTCPIQTLFSVRLCEAKEGIR